MNQSSLPRLMPMVSLNTDDQRDLFKLLRAGKFATAEKRLAAGRGSLSTDALAIRPKETNGNHHLTPSDLGLLDWIMARQTVDVADPGVKINILGAVLKAGDETALVVMLDRIGGWPPLETPRLGHMVQEAITSDNPHMLTRMLASAGWSWNDLRQQLPSFDPYISAIRLTVFAAQSPLAQTLAHRFADWAAHGIVPLPLAERSSNDNAQVLVELVQKQQSVPNPGHFVATWNLLCAPVFGQDPTQLYRHRGNDQPLQAIAESLHPDAFRADARQKELTQRPAAPASRPRRRS